MKTSTANAMIIFGLILTMFGVGGVEHSMNNADMITATVVAIVGLMIMWVGSLGQRQGHYYDSH